MEVADQGQEQVDANTFDVAAERENFFQMFGQTIGHGAGAGFNGSLDQRDAIKSNDQDGKAFVTVGCDPVGEPACRVNM